jgi:hypothetical protein
VYVWMVEEPGSRGLRTNISAMMQPTAHLGRGKGGWVGEGSVWGRGAGGRVSWWRSQAANISAMIQPTAHLC